MAIHSTPVRQLSNVALVDEFAILTLQLQHSTAGPEREELERRCEAVKIEMCLRMRGSVHFGE